MNDNSRSAEISNGGAASPPAEFSSAFVPWLVVGLTILIFAGSIYWLSAHLRKSLRTQILQRDSQVLNAISGVQRSVQEDLFENSDDPLDHLQVVLESSKFTEGVIAIRLFDPTGKLVTAFPPTVADSSLSAEDLAALHTLKPISHFHSKADLSAQFIALPTTNEVQTAQPEPLLETIVPLPTRDGKRLAGAAQFITPGQAVAEEFRALDQHLFKYGAFLFTAGSLVILAALGWAIHHLQRANQLLEERTARLLQANHELTLSAKTSALGAVTAHLIHGLKNPLAGLQSFVSTRGSDTDFLLAAASAKKMQNMISEIVRILQEEKSGAQYEMTLEELADIIQAKIAGPARERGVRFTIRQEAQGALENKAANLISLILYNLIHNAIEAVPSGKAVELRLLQEGGGVVFEVRDEGPGLPDRVREQLFTPCQSTRAGGSGLGLAISKQLANHLGANLDLKETSPRGSTFALAVPEKVFLQKNNLYSSPALQ